jgi:valine dehydrogenase (NAD+)
VTSTSTAQHVYDSGHEQVVVCHDAASGLRAIIAIHSTALGPALGGTRFYPYPDADAAMTDALHLSKGMTYKNALAGLDHGGGKAVIIGDPATLKSEPLLRAYGRFVQSLGGRYVTACDVGTYVHDMDVIARECDFVTGRSEADGGAGDSSVLTSLGVFQGMRAAAAHRWGSPTLRGRRVGIAGVGKVGRLLVEHLIGDGAEVVVTDVNQAAVDRLRLQHPQVDVVDSTEQLVTADLDVYAPCALGDALTPGVVQTLKAAIVCGAANNQLAGEADGGREVADQLVERGILYCPDYLVNAGGVVQVADERRGFVFDRARQRVEKIFDTTAEVLALADSEHVSPSVAADRLAEQRIEGVVGVRRTWLPGRR